MSRYGCAGETGRNRVGVLRPSAPQRCGADHRQPAREGRQADDPRTDHKRERTEGGPIMKYRSTTKVAGVALAVASITALAACSSGGSSSSGGSNNSSSSVVKVNGVVPEIEQNMSIANLPVYSNGNKTLTITMKSNYKWSNGKPLTANDLLFAIDLIKAAIKVSPANWAGYTPKHFPDNLVSTS